MDDTISRQEAIRIASGYCHPANIADELRKLPSVQPEPQWIPMSEREPEEGGHYLITARYEGDVIVVSDDYYSYGWDDWKDDVIAWAELPEPYKGGKDAD